MATLEQLTTALRNADAAGDVDAARVLAAEVSKMQSQPVAKGSILPLSRDAGGNVSFDSDAGIVGALKRAFTLPGEVMRGEASPNDTGRVMELATMATPVNPAIRAGDRAIPGISKAIGQKPAVVPTAKELELAGKTDIRAAQDSGLQINPAAVGNFSQQVQQELYQRNIHPQRAPETYKALQQLENAPPGSTFTPAGLQTLRETLQDIAQNFNSLGKDQAAASAAIGKVDGFLQGLDPKSVVAGGAPAQVAAQFERGRGNYAAGMRANEISGELDKATTGLLERAEGRAQAANSGRNTDNTIRSRAASMLEKPKELSGLSAEEIAALEHVRDGGAGRNSLRYVGNLLGGGGGLGQSVTAGIGAAVGGAAGGWPGAAVGAALPAVAGAGAKSFSNHLARKEMKALDEMMRKRSPLFKERVANPETFVISPEKRAALMRLMATGQFSQQ
jgi:hypothetical protein